jgi:hypothetical protein
MLGCLEPWYIRLKLLVHVAERRWHGDALLDGEAQPVCLARPVVRVLSENDNLIVASIPFYSGQCDCACVCVGGVVSADIRIVRCS